MFKVTLLDNNIYKDDTKYTVIKVPQLTVLRFVNCDNHSQRLNVYNLKQVNREQQGALGEQEEVVTQERRAKLGLRAARASLVPLVLLVTLDRQVALVMLDPQVRTLISSY